MRRQASVRRTPFSQRADEAVQRAMAGRHRQAADEVERILAAAVTVMERVAPGTPRVSDVVAEAGTSNKAFYRYFAGKEDLILAVMDRGVRLVMSYIEHQMAKDDDPLHQIARWIEGVLAQSADDRAARSTRAVTAQLALLGDGQLADDEITRPLRDLLVDPVTRLGSSDPRRDSDAVFEAVFGTMRRRLALASSPDREGTEHLTSFCLNAILAGAGGGSSFRR